MVVAYAADKKLYDYLRPSIAALLDHNSQVEKIHIFIKEPLDRELYGLTDNRIVIHQFKDTLECISSLGPYADYRLGLMTFTRLGFPVTLEEDRVLYLDVDTFVRKDLSDFYNIDFDNNLVAGVAEPKKSTPQNPYLNAGVLLMNLDLIRRSGVWVDWIDKMNHGPYYRDGDQDIIHHTCAGRKLTVDPTYNSNLYTKNVDDPYIEHGTPTKPWNSNFKYYREYLEYDNRRVK